MLNKKIAEKFFKKAVADYDAMDGELLKKVLKRADGVVLNSNDVFAWGCADSEFVDRYDLPKVLEIYEKFSDDGLIAFMAHLTGNTPQKPLQTPEYKAAREFLKGWKPYESAARELPEE